MRIAVVSDIHDNLTALEAVLRDLRQTAPDLILHGGDLVNGGSRPVEVVARIRELGWPGVIGNTEESVATPETLEHFAGSSSAPASLWTAVREMVAHTRELLGDENIAWLRGLPRVHVQSPIALVHASPEDPWRSPGPEASNVELRETFSGLGQPIAVYGHIHQPFVRRLEMPTVINSGSVSQSFDGDPRASYLLLDDYLPSIRRVEYDIDREIKAVFASGVPHAGWVVRILKTARPQMP